MIDWTKEITPDQIAQSLTDAEVAAIKQRRETAIHSGVLVQGIPIHTDETSQNRIMGAAVSAMLDPAYTVAWKAATGDFIDLTASQVIGIATTVRAHVQACFDREAALLGDLKADRTYDIDAGWPDGVI